jgi:sulfhydrogenase subunit delta
MPAGAARPRLRVGIVKMASCDGCQLTLLDLEDELLALAERFEIVEFPEASSLRSAGPYDVLLVEGSVSTPDHAAEIVELRRQAKLLVTIGACASYGGIQALRNWSDHDAFRAAVYAHPGVPSAPSSSARSWCRWPSAGGPRSARKPSAWSASGEAPCA